MTSKNAAFRQQAILSAQQHIEQLPVYLDTETTGVSTNDEIVEICILDHDGSVLLSTLVKPQNHIPADVTRLHGITDEMVRDAPTWPDVWLLVLAALHSRSVGIYNAEFDLRLMQQSHKRARLRWQPLETDPFCIMRLYASFRGELRRDGLPRWYSLEEAGRQCHIPLPNAHRARADALLAREVLHCIARSIR
jgi:DNA polymerase III subunit epsilon